MSEFRRFMSYIYSYHKAEKLKNTGFAKIEARGEVCRMEIHIKGASSVTALQSNIYGFYEDRGLLTGIYLGTFVIKNGVGDVRLVTERNNMGNSKKSLEDLQGLYLSLNDDEENAMASAWDNISVDTSRFKVFTQEEEEQPFSEKPAEIQKDIDQAEEVCETVETVETVEAVGTVETVEAVEQVEEVEKNIPVEETVLEEQSCACGELDFSVENFSENDQPCGLKKWKEMMREYPVVNPFEYLDYVEVIKIEPKDIAKLEKKYWILANNSFLLHGYCSYRYLILGKNLKEDSFFIGIPGVFHPREKMMAGMFGFSQFQMSRTGNLRQGEFGYYIRTVELK